MASIGISGSEPVAQHHTEFSGWWKRVGATLVDSLIILVPIIIVAALAGETGSAIVIVVALIASLLYAPLLLARDGANNGQTIGKQVVGIRVVHESGEPMTFGRGILREFVGKSILGAIPLYSLIDVLFPLWDGRKQAIHDKIGSTTVHLAQ